MVKCRHFWRSKSWHHNDRKWYCQLCLVKRAKELSIQFRAHTSLDTWFPTNKD